MVITNKAQRVALLKLFTRNPDNAKTYKEFRKRIFSAFGGDCIMIRWCDMYIGIEKDGYTHS